MLDLSLPSALVPGTNLLASRISYDFNEHLRVGTIVTNGDPEALRNNTLAGIDAVWRTSKFMGDKNFLVGGWSATTQGDLPNGSKMAWGFKVDYPNDLWDCQINMNQYGEGFEPLLGFLPRPGTRQTDLGCSYQPRPSKDGPLRWIRQAFVENEYSRVTDSRGVHQGYLITSKKITIEGQALNPGQYGFGFVDGKFRVMDVGANDVMSVAFHTDDKLQRPAPFKVSVSGSDYRIYAGKKYVSVNIQ